MLHGLVEFLRDGVQVVSVGAWCYLRAERTLARSSPGMSTPHLVQNYGITGTPEFLKGLPYIFDFSSELGPGYMRGEG